MKGVGVLSQGPSQSTSAYLLPEQAEHLAAGARAFAQNDYLARNVLGNLSVLLTMLSPGIQ